MESVTRLIPGQGFSLIRTDTVFRQLYSFDGQIHFKPCKCQVDDSIDALLGRTVEITP